MQIIKPIVELAWEYLDKIVKYGDIAVDATAGNGHDTVKLAKLVGEDGRVYAFDIQTEAICKTQQKIENNNLTERVTLLKKSHVKIAEYVPTGVSAIVFNLGYLPSGDHTVTTNAKDTIYAVETGMSLLKPGGLLVISVYCGHDEGKKEKEALATFLAKPQQKAWGALEISIPNREEAPSLLIIEKI